MLELDWAPLYSKTFNFLLLVLRLVDNLLNLILFLILNLDVSLRALPFNKLGNLRMHKVALAYQWSHYRLILHQRIVEVVGWISAHHHWLFSQYRFVADHFILELFDLTSEILDFFLKPLLSSLLLLLLEVDLCFDADVLDLELDAPHFNDVICLKYVVAALVVVAYDGVLDYTEHSLFHLVGRQNRLATFMIEIVDVLQGIRGLYTLNKVALAFLVDAEQLLVIRTEVFLHILVCVNALDVEALAKHHLALVCPKILLAGLEHLKVKQAMGALFPLDELHVEVVVIEAVVVQHAHVLLIGKHHGIFLWHIAQHSAAVRLAVGLSSLVDLGWKGLIRLLMDYPIAHIRWSRADLVVEPRIARLNGDLFHALIQIWVWSQHAIRVLEPSVVVELHDNVLDFLSFLAQSELESFVVQVVIEDLAAELPSDRCVYVLDDALDHIDVPVVVLLPGNHICKFLSV